MYSRVKKIIGTEANEIIQSNWVSFNQSWIGVKAIINSGIKVITKIADTCYGYQFEHTPKKIFSYERTAQFDKKI